MTSQSQLHERRSFRRGIAALALIVALAAPGTARAAAGDLDPTFAGDGTAATPALGFYAATNASAVQSDGKIVAVGYCCADPAPPPEIFHWKAAVARFLPDGTLDETFGDDGLVTTDVGSSTDHGEDVAIQRDGKIVVGVTAYDFLEPLGGQASTFAVVRYLPDGTLDASFGGDGVVRTSSQPCSSTCDDSDDQVGSVLIQPDGKLVAVGNAGPVLRPMAVRYHPDGTLDDTFGTGGVAQSSLIRGGVAPTGIRQPDGRILVAGWRGIIRLEADGDIDQTFGVNGLVANPDPGNLYEIALGPAGTILATTTDLLLGPPSFRVRRWLPGGTPDPAWGVGGVIAVANGFDIFPGGLAVDKQGSVFVGGRGCGSDDRDDCMAFIARFDEHGNPDGAYGEGGTAVYPALADIDDLVFQPDGKLVGTRGELPTTRTRRRFASRASSSTRGPRACPAR